MMLTVVLASGAEIRLQQAQDPVKLQIGDNQKAFPEITRYS